MKPEYAKYYQHPRLVFAKLLQYASPLVPDDETYLKWLYRLKIGERLDLKNPQSYTAKLQWMKLYNRNPLLCRYIDKFEVKKEVERLIGPEHVIPTFGVWENAKDIDFEALPEQFVLKCTHDSKSVILCRDKHSFNQDLAREKLQKALSQNAYTPMREWAYKNVQPRIIAEELINDPSQPGGLNDYKFFCFDGQVKALYVATGRVQGHVCFDFFDRDFHHLPAFNEFHPHASTPIPKPANYEEMVKLAQQLSQGFPHVRIDLYSIGGQQVLFSEYTFYHAGGLSEFVPREWDYKFGEWFKLPEPYSASNSR